MPFVVQWQFVQFFTIVAVSKLARVNVGFTAAFKLQNHFPFFPFTKFMHIKKTHQIFLLENRNRLKK